MHRISNGITTHGVLKILGIKVKGIISVKSANSAQVVYILTTGKDSKHHNFNGWNQVPFNKPFNKQPQVIAVKDID